MSDFCCSHDGFYFVGTIVGCDFKCFFNCHFFFTVAEAFYVP